ncbi:hypothetical protein B0T21DRAFT_282222 [Apiosordaria backusii]|uniref:Uncharacterized protein n=1 Tax=Apiosordaria backusii TaxID=314023 RepID=A0AA40K156_9PEZI|nr:hypothetical protein B0T21DRAFT_282222 [Apiosordaria backusii]
MASTSDQQAFQARLEASPTQNNASKTIFDASPTPTKASSSQNKAQHDNLKAYDDSLEAYQDSREASQDSRKAYQDSREAFQTNLEAYSIPNMAFSSPNDASVDHMQGLLSEFDGLTCDDEGPGTYKTIHQWQKVDPPVFPVYDRFCLRKPNVGMQHGQLTKELLIRSYTGKPFPLIEQHGPNSTRERFGEQVWNIHDLMHKHWEEKHPPTYIDGVLDEFNAEGESPVKMSETLVRIMREEAQFAGKRLYETF